MSARPDLTTEELIRFAEMHAQIGRAFGTQDADRYEAIAQRLRSERPVVTPEMETLQLKLTGVLHAVGEMLVDEKHLRWHVTRLRSALQNWGRHHDWCNVRKSPLGDAPPEACNCGLVAELSVSSTEGKPPGEGNG